MKISCLNEIYFKGRNLFRYDKNFPLEISDLIKYEISENYDKSP